MSTTGVVAGPLLAVVLVLLTIVAAAIHVLGGLSDWRPVVIAAVRAAVQLAVVSLVITAVLGSGLWTALFVLLMFLVAAATAAGRIHNARLLPWTVLPVGLAVGPVLALLMASTAVPAHPAAVIPIAGILIGGAMTATVLAGRRSLEELRTRHGEYEAALALGLVRRDAALEISRPAAALALIPTMDQTRTVGLVTLPGAFVGVLLGGGSPVQAGVTQLLVLISLVAVQAAAVLLTVELVAAGRITR